MRRKWKRALSLLCTLAMIAGMLPVSSLAAAGTAQTVSGGINGYAAAMQADEVTSDGWRTAFEANSVSDAQEIDGTSRSSALNGKIWTDKSVSIGENNEFNVTFSALGQTFASQEASQQDLAYDVVFVVDVSSSMNESMPYPNRGSRMDATVDALNTAADMLMENSNNRMAVVRFSGEADTYVSLGHYEKSDDRYGQIDYFSKSGNYDITFTAQGFYGHRESIMAGTNQQRGYFEAGSVLTGVSMPAGSNVKRIPVIIMLTDGSPSYYPNEGITSDWKTGEFNDGSVTVTISEESSDYFYTICTAAYQKDLIQNQYRSSSMNNDNSTTARIYTIGLGLDEYTQQHISNDAIMLNPVRRSEYPDGNLSRAINNNPAAKMGFSSYDYANGSWVNASMTSEQLNKIFEDIMSDLGDLGVNTDVGESTGERNRITYFETLGEGVQFTGKMTLTVPKYDIVDNEIVEREPVTYTLRAYKGDTDEVLNPAEGPAYLASGGVVTFRDDNYQEELANLSITVRQLSDGMRQMQVDIPPELMAYNVFITKSEDGQPVYEYYEATQPLQLTYGVKMRADVETAGSYLVSAPTRSYVHFIPSSAQTVEDIYDMPYYWPGGQFANDQAQVDKNKTDETDEIGEAGASDYVTAATKGNNNDVYIYLGNNGLYQLTGKTMTLTVNWSDTNNQDGLRPSDLKVQLYADPTGGTGVDSLQKIGSAVTLPAANSGDGNSLTYTFENLKVYLEETTVAKYYVAFLGADGQPLTFTATDHTAPFTDYTYAIGNEGADQKENYFLFDGYEDNEAAAMGHLTLNLTHELATVDYTVTKQWVDGTGTSATMQLLADGVAATADQLGGQDGTITLDGSESWTHTWTDLPKYSNGHEIVYRAAETNYVGGGGIYYQTSYDFGTNSATVTNTAQNAEAAQMNFTARVVWNDANNQDGVRPESVTLKLVAKVGEELVTSDAVFGADFQWTQEVRPGVDNTWTTVWENLPRFTTGNEQITYSIVEMNGEQEVSVGGQLNDEYKVAAYNNFGDGYMTVTNTHTPVTVDITINKIWNDADNQDGIRPNSVTGSLYRAEGSSYVKVQDFVINGESWSATINGLPQKAGGQEIAYYVSENAVAEYELTASGSSVTVDDSKAAYPVIDGAVTLTNTHNPGTVGYQVILTWDDNENVAGMRPSSVTVNLGSGYSVTLTVGNGNTGITAVDTRKLPQGAEAVWDTGSNTLKVTRLPEFVNGEQQTYQGSVADIANYDETITAFGPNSVSYKLSYTGSTSYNSLGFTKYWKGDFEGGSDYYGYDMRPSTSEYAAKYLTLEKRVGESGEWTRVENPPAPTIYENPTANTYSVSYQGLPQFENGQVVTYRVTEGNVPNYTATENAVELQQSVAGATLTNTFTLVDPDEPGGGNTYGEITVTKVWNDADAPEGSRPAYESSDPLGIMLYRATDGTHANGIAPNKIVDNGDGTWTYTWDAGTVLKTDKDGSTIDYVAYENTVPSNYTATTQSANVTKDGNVVSGARIVNAYSGTAATGTLTITKTWAGDEQYTDKRPDSLTFIVKGTFVGSDDATQITRTATMSKAKNWASATVEDLPLTVNGQPVTYTVEESNIPAGYKATYENGQTVVLATSESNAATVAVKNTYSPDTWKLTYDANGAQGQVPTDASDYTPARNTANVQGQPAEMIYKGYTFLGWTTTRMPVILAASQEPEEDDLYVAGEQLTMSGATTLYAVWAVDDNGDGTPDYEQKQITVNVVWDDDGNRCGIRPNSIAFTLKGHEYAIDLADASGVLITTSNGNTQWIYTVPALFDQSEEFADGDLTNVTVNHKAHADASDAEGYTPSVSFADKAYTITLTHTPEPTSHDVTKTWDFGHADFSIGTATIRLLANGQRAVDVTGTEVEDITFNSDGDQDLTWYNLPKYEGGKLITYHAVETQVMNGGVDVTGHFQVTYDWDDENGTTTITNTYSELRNITLLYTWDDDNNATGERPDSVEVELYYTTRQDTRAPVEAVPTGITATISEAGNWSTTWYDLPVSQS